MATDALGGIDRRVSVAEGPGRKLGHAGVTGGAIIRRRHMRRWRIGLAKHHDARWQLVRTIVTGEASGLGLRVVKDLGGRPSRIVGDMAIFAEVGRCQMRRVFASDGLEDNTCLVAAVMAGEARACDEAMEIGIQCCPNCLAGVTAGAGRGAGQDMDSIASGGQRAIMALFASLAGSARITVIERQLDRHPSGELRGAMAIVASCRGRNVIGALGRGQFAIMASKAGGCATGGVVELGYPGDKGRVARAAVGRRGEWNVGRWFRNELARCDRCGPIVASNAGVGDQRMFRRAKGDG